MTISILIFFRSVDISTIDMSYRYIEQGYLAFLWKRIRIAVALIEEGSKAIGQLCLTLFFPLIPFLLQVGFKIDSSKKL